MWSLRVACGVVLAVAASGCSSLFDIGNPHLAVDATVSHCTIGSYDLCASQQPAGAIVFDSVTAVDTGLDCNVVLFDPDGGSSCVIYATNITVTLGVTGTGPRPLVLAATGSIQVAGVIDVSSRTNSMTSMTGAGADDHACVPAPSLGFNSTPGFPGGSFGGTGGAGGAGTASQGLQPAPAVAPPPYPRGGCPGTSPSGGAIWLVAGGSVTLTSTGQVLAGGAAGGQGLGGSIGLGGGAGGAGGFIRVAAPAVTIAGILEANGGGGAGGGSASVIGGGDACGTAGIGSDAAPGSAAAAGGLGCSGGGNGGKGAAGTTLAGGSGTIGVGQGSASAGGGGGGGGAGIIQLDSPALDTTGATISPPPM